MEYGELNGHVIEILNSSLLEFALFSIFQHCAYRGWSVRRVVWDIKRQNQSIGLVCGVRERRRRQGHREFPFWKSKIPPRLV